MEEKIDNEMVKLPENVPVFLSKERVKNHSFIKVFITIITGLLGGFFVGIPLTTSLLTLLFPEGIGTGFIDSGVGYFIYLFFVFVGPMIPFMLLGLKIANKLLDKSEIPSNAPNKKSKNFFIIIVSIIVATIIAFFLLGLLISVVIGGF